MRLRQWDAVEHQLGHPVSAELRAAADDLVFASSNELEATIRAQVARGAPVTERWVSIRGSEETFVADYVVLIGLDPIGYDALLGEPFSP